jgi:hypothetical protein
MLVNQIYYTNHLNITQECDVHGLYFWNNTTQAIEVSNEGYSAPESVFPESASPLLSASPVHPASSCCAHNFESLDMHEIFATGDAPALQLWTLSEYSRVEQNRKSDSQCTLEKLVANFISHGTCREIVSQALWLKRPYPVHTDSTRRDRNREVWLVLRRMTSRTGWWHMKRPKPWGRACASRHHVHTTGWWHEEAETVSQDLCFKGRHHVHNDGTRRNSAHANRRDVLRKIMIRWMGTG